VAHRPVVSGILGPDFGHHSHDTNLALAGLVADVTLGKPHTPRLATDHDRGYRGSPSPAEVVLGIAVPGRITGVTRPAPPRPPHGLLKFLGLILAIMVSLAPFCTDCRIS
jgi:hypothetical protein